MAAKSSARPGKARINSERLWVHIALGLFTVVCCQAAIMLDPSLLLAEPLSLGLGYVGLFYIAVSLLIGPLYLARQRRNPVNIYLRRDIGIWAGITSLLHVLFGFQIFEQGQVLLYFFSQIDGQLRPLLDLFGVSNYLGLVAALLALVLLLLSNDISLRWLKGKRWKNLQRLTYPLVVLAILHTLGYQISNERDAAFVVALLALSLLLAVAQGSGVLVYRRRQSARTTAASPGATQAGANPYLLPTAAAEGLSRRGFLVYGSTALVGAIGALIGFRVVVDVAERFGSELPSAASPTSTPAVVGALPPTSAAPTATATSLATATTAESAVSPQPTATDAPTTAPTTTATAPAPTTTLAPIAPTATAATSPGTVLATLASCPLNSAVNFTTPDTGQTGILIHEADGSVKAFSNVCTHRPYPVEYDPVRKDLICPLHRALFNASTGQATAGPAHRALPAIAVHVDDQGNILYGA